ncbi:T9SS type A sorting domain-containing protein [Hymenobacter setariae]|uniref:T9SS type A sorting domain-containing protein n=1 Tax=Hymenobacter setariae TaxID=2594794 RepID=A0A558BZ58_9BACT|nr:T9SS type A sorting domain-containing protein [Hymenobacter setariae]TVT41807.1 T9SS type A sorting domain-containing protein [Hymenobacter setariae]
MFRLPTAVLLPTFRRLALASLGLLPIAASAQTITGFSPAQAAAGATVTITGTGLANIKSAMINGQPMKVTGTPLGVTMQVIVPVAAATGRIRVTTNAGTVLSANKLGITRKSSSVSYGQSSTSVTGASATGNYSTPTMGDLDSDGRIELIQGQGDGTIMVYEQTAANSTAFGAGTLLKNADGSTLDVGNFAKPTVADLDSDGLLELLVGEETGNVLRYEQTAAGAQTFTRSNLFTNPFGTATSGAPNGGSYPRPTVADLDNNGLLDVLVGSNDGTLRRYEQTAANAATFTALGQMRDNLGAIIDAGDVDKPLLTDYDGDGYLDMLLGNRAGNIILYTQTAANSAVFKKLDFLKSNGSTISVGTYAAPSITDIDGNGLLDLFVGNANGTIYRFEQAASATQPTLAPGALTNPSPLPVVLTAFTGQAGSAGNVLRWATASETNSAHFEVERSADGQAFVKIGQLAAAGTSMASHSYQFIDDAATATSYYRLRQVDLDGTSSYSPVVTLAARLTAPAAAKLVAYPTVFTSELSVALPGAENQAATVALLTADGRPVYTHTMQLGTAPQALAELPTLAPGVYLLRVATATGANTQRVVRN